MMFTIPEVFVDYPNPMSVTYALMNNLDTFATYPKLSTLLVSQFEPKSRTQMVYVL